jgi:RluA family pseudouridine synthase
MNKKWFVSLEQSHCKLLLFLTDSLQNQYSARAVKKMIESNRCRINGRVERLASTPVMVGDEIDLVLEEKKLHILSFESSRIIYEDQALLIYNKPAGITCDESGMIKIFKAYAPELFLIHRLDRNTTGILLFAKTQVILQEMIRQFKCFQVQKSYLAIVQGKLAKPQGKIENFLSKKISYEGQTIWGKDSHGLYACTDWKELKKGKQVSLVNCFPRTGRTHQIRVHMSEMGHPIVGDFQYGAKPMNHYHPVRYLLHAEKIGFYHPISQEFVSFVSPLPLDFSDAMKKLF